MPFPWIIAVPFGIVAALVAGSKRGGATTSKAPPQVKPKPPTNQPKRCSPELTVGLTYKVQGPEKAGDLGDSFETISANILGRHDEKDALALSLANPGIDVDYLFTSKSAPTKILHSKSPLQVEPDGTPMKLVGAFPETGILLNLPPSFYPYVYCPKGTACGGADWQSDGDGATYPTCGLPSLPSGLTLPAPPDSSMLQ